MHKILIIEDDIHLQSILQVLFERHNYNAEFAFDGEDGIQKTRDTNYDLIVTDIHLPDVSGLDIISNLKKNKDCPPIIVISGGDVLRNNDKTDLEKAREMDIEALFEKPFDHDKFMSVIDDTLNKIAA